MSGGSPQHYGFVRDGAGLSYFRVPGASFTQAWGVNARGEVVGYYVKDGAVRGFLKNGDEFVEIAYPGADETYVLGINASGDIVGGAWFEATGHEEGFVAKRTR